MSDDINEALDTLKKKHWEEIERIDLLHQAALNRARSHCSDSRLDELVKGQEVILEALGTLRKEIVK